MRKIRLLIVMLSFISLLNLASCEVEHEHIWTEDTIEKNATCTEEGLKRVKCVLCDETENQIIEKTEHSYNTTIIKPTCTEEGKETKVCSICGDSEEKILDKTGHVVVVDERIEPTCKQMGLTEGTHCSECKKILQEQEKIPTIEHEFLNGRCVNCLLIDMDFDVLPGTTEGLEYELSDTKDYYILIGIGECVEKDIIVSSIYKGLPVKEIGNNAFNNSFSLKGVKLPESILIIGDNAFGNCSILEKVEFSNGLTSIGDSTFSGCKSLVNIVLPNTLERMGWQAFYNCVKLESIYIPKSVTYVGYDAFKKCDVLTINCEAEKQPRGWNVSWNSDNRPVKYNQTK